MVSIFVATNACQLSICQEWKANTLVGILSAASAKINEPSRQHLRGAISKPKSTTCSIIQNIRNGSAQSLTTRHSKLSTCVNRTVLLQDSVWKRTGMPSMPSHGIQSGTCYVRLHLLTRLLRCGICVICRRKRTASRRTRTMSSKSSGTHRRLIYLRAAAMIAAYLCGIWRTLERSRRKRRPRTVLRSCEWSCHNFKRHLD